MIEYRRMYEVKGVKVHFLLPEIFGGIFSYIFIFNNELQDFLSIIFLVGAFVMAFLITIIRNKKPYVETTMSTVTAILFIFCGLHIIKLCEIFPKNYEIISIIIYFSAVLIGDYIASKIGPKYKKIYIAKEISPNKTLIGAIANLVGTCTLCLFLPYSTTINLVVGCVISIFAQIGDLTLSTIKRDIGIKHSSNLFFDYGGIFDRIDAFIFSAPAMYYCLLIISG